MIQEPRAAVTATTTSGAGVELRFASGPVAVDADGATAPDPLHLLLGAHAADVTAVARAHLQRDGDPGDVEVVVSLDDTAPPLLYRRVLVTVALRPDDAARLATAVERSETTQLLGAALTIRTAVEHDGDALT